MHDAIRMKVLCAQYDLVDYLLHSLLWQSKISFRDVVEQIFSNHKLNNDVVVLTGLKKFIELDYV